MLQAHNGNRHVWCVEAKCLADLCHFTTCHRSYNPTSKALTAQWQNPGGSLVDVKFVQSWEAQDGGIYFLSATAATDFQLFCRKYCYGENGVNDPAQPDCKDRLQGQVPYICHPEKDTGLVTFSFEARM